jgi:hypothetical protein
MKNLIRLISLWFCFHYLLGCSSSFTCIVTGINIEGAEISRTTSTNATEEEFCGKVDQLPFFEEFEEVIVCECD